MPKEKAIQHSVIGTTMSGFSLIIPLPSFLGCRSFVVAVSATKVKLILLTLSTSFLAEFTLGRKDFDSLLKMFIRWLRSRLVIHGSSQSCRVAPQVLSPIEMASGNNATIISPNHIGDNAQ